MSRLQAVVLDVDECTVDMGGCSDVCMNTAGSYRCLCTEGYSLKEDGMTCAGN